jgi:hypothetical protein
MLKPFVCAAVTAVLLLASPGQSHGDDARYTGEFSDGKRIENAQLTGWGNDNFPRLNGQALFDQASPIRWLRRDTTEQATVPQAFIEMVGGDVLPGRVMGLGPTATLPEGEIGANLLVEPAIPLNAPDASPRSVVRVLTRWLRRVVWQRRSIDPYQPGTLFLRDGRQLAFKAVRFENRGVSVLTDIDRRVIPYGELAELDLPRMDGWEAYFEQLALLTPDCGLRLMRVETLDGLRATASSERFRPTFFGDAANPDHWYHALQPAWSLDPLFVRHRTVNMRWFYGPHELPLSLVEASQVNLRSALAVGWRPQRDRNVQGGPLDSGGKQYGWGLGMQAYTEMSFPLPACAEAFQSLVGLDRVVGTGGCARAIVYADSASGTPLFRSNHLIGSSKDEDTGRLKLSPAADGHSQLVLVAHPAHADRPPGADPLDIRDVVDWLEPQLFLNLEKLRAEVRGRVVRQVPGLEGWTIEGGNDPLVFASRFDQNDPRNRRFYFEFRPRAGNVTLSRSLHIEPEQNWLLLYVTRNPDGGTTTPTQAIVRIDGKPVTEFDVPIRANWATPAHAIPVEKFHDRQVNLEVRLEAKGDKSFVDWRSLALVDRVPTLAELFEDAPQAPIRFKPNGAAEITTSDRYAGNACIKVAGPGRAIAAKPTEPKTGDLKPAVQAAMATLTNMNFAIREQPRFGEYRYLHFAYKKHGGEQFAMDLSFELPSDGVLLDARPLARKFRPIRSKPDPKLMSRPPADRHRIALGNQAVVEDQNFDPLADVGQPPIQSQYRYYAGRHAAPQGDERGALLAEKAPDQWTIITRDLFQDFGAGQLTGLTLTCPDGDYALLDHVYLGRTQQDFEKCPPAAPPLPAPKK